MSVSHSTSALGEPESEFPRTWRWDEDGDIVEGAYVRLDEGHTANGPCPIVVLNVAGEERSVWLWHEAARSKFAREVARRPSGDLTVHEHVYVRRLGKRESGNGRTYIDYDVRFPERPRRSAKEILGEASTNAGDDVVVEDEPADDGIPF